MAWLIFYFVIFITGFPFLFFFTYSIWSLLLRNWRWDIKRKLLLLNSAIYPFIFVGTLLLLTKLFGVDTEARALIDTIVDYSKAQSIPDPEVTGIRALGPVFPGTFVVIMYFMGSLVPTTLVTLVYSIGSTALIFRMKEAQRWWIPFGIATLLSFTCIGFGYAFRTPIFNWLARI